MDFSLNVGDELPSIEAVLTANGDVMDLTGYDAVEFIGSTADGTVIGGTASFGTKTAGEVSYDWSATDADEPGVYRIAWRLNETTTNKKITIPSHRPATLVITDDIGA